MLLPGRVGDMLRSLSRLVGLPAVAVLLVAGIAIMILAAIQNSQTAQVFAGFVAVLVVAASLVMLFAVYLKRLNADIDSDRHELRRELDEMVEDDDAE
jgi:TRAP-type C4-dicarboxylate transport system permease small subunit